MLLPLYGATFNKLFLAYVALTTLSFLALVYGLLAVDVEQIVQQFHKKTPVKGISAFMLFMAILLGGMWSAQSLSFVFTGQVPPAIVSTGHSTGIVFATDLSILIPGLMMASILLWKRKPWGYVFSALMMVKSTTYGLALIAMSAFATNVTSDPFLPLWVLLTIGCLITSTFLLGNMNASVPRRESALLGV